MPPTNAYHTTLIDSATVIYFNCGKNSHFALSCLELKDIGVSRNEVRRLCEVVALAMYMTGYCMKVQEVP